MQDRTLRIPFGYRELDTMTLGMWQKDLIIMAGRPSMGKSALMVNVALHVSENYPIMIESAEMSRKSPDISGIENRLSNHGPLIAGIAAIKTV